MPNDLALVSFTGNLNGNFFADITADGELVIVVSDTIFEGNEFSEPSDDLVVSGTFTFAVTTPVPEPSGLLPIAGLSLFVVDGESE